MLPQIRIFTVLCIFLLVARAFTLESTTSSLTGGPIVFIHGVMGSQLIERSTKIVDKENACKRKGPTDFQYAWVNKKRLVQHHSCVFDILKQNYSGDDSHGGAYMYEQNPNYEVEVVPGTKGVAYLDKHTKYLEDFFAFLESTGNWKRDENLQAFNYDWRLNPLSWEVKGMYRDLESMITKLHEKYGKRVTVIAHSNGNVVFANFMRFMRSYIDADFADKYISRYLAVAPAFSGSPLMFQIYSGLLPKSDVHHFPKFLHTLISPLCAGISGVNYLMPRPEAHSDIHHPLLTVEETGETFGFKDIEGIFWNLHSIPADVKKHWHKTKRVMSSDAPGALYPGIEEIHFIYSVDVPVSSSITISKWPKSVDDLTKVKSKITAYSNGDGTMIASTVRHYVKAFRAAAASNMCGSGKCVVEEQRVRMGIDHTGLVNGDAKHHLLRNWVMKHVEH